MAKLNSVPFAKVTEDEEKRAVGRIGAVYDRLKREGVLNQTILAERMGLKQQSAVSQYLRRKIPLNMTAVIRFSYALKVSPSYLYPELMDSVRKLFYPEISVSVRVAINGNSTVQDVNHIQMQNGLDPYAVEVNVDDYLPYIRNGSFIVCSSSVEPKAGSKVFVELSDGSRFIARLLNEDAGITQVLKLQDNRIYDLLSSVVEHCDMVIDSPSPDRLEIRE